MGDDDVICLSSDDEVSSEKLSLKEPKIPDGLLIAKIEPKEDGTIKVACGTKRKTVDDSAESDESSRKKSKIGNVGIEEITIESPSKDANGTIEPASGALGNRPWLTVRTDVISNGNLDVDKVAIRKSPESENSQKAQPARRDSQERDVKSVAASKSQVSKSNCEGLLSRVINPVALMRERENAKNPYAIASINAHKASKRKVSGELEKSANETTNLSDSRIKVPKSASSATTGDESESDTTSKLRGKKFESAVRTIDDESSIVAAESLDDATKDLAKENSTSDSQTVRETCDSPELLILASSETTNGSSTASDKNAVKIQSADAVEVSTHSETTVARDVEKIVDETTDSTNGIDDAKACESTTTTKANEETASSSKSDTMIHKIRTRIDETPRKRLTPKRLPDLSDKSNRSIPNDEGTSKYFNDSSSSRSKNPSDSRIANSDEKTIANESTNLRIDKESTSMDYESLPGCSKSSESKKSPSSSPSSSKRKSSRSEMVERKNDKVDEPKTLDSEPQPGCSSSPPKIHEKPRLIVVEKKPVLHAEDQDTFSMFLSLCLQTDRCPDMERIVAKLKNYYEQLNPEYAASEIFRDSLNDKREVIMRKGKKVVYHYVQLLQKDMKARRKKSRTKANGSEMDADEETKMADASGSKVEEDADETRRKNHKIKRIEKAMRECQRMIKKYEEAEVDWDDENNSHYIKLERFKQRMIELYTQMCKYTDDHPDAGRSYLRPKHLRVTQIPSIDQAINSFINSKLSFNNRRLTTGKSFVDGLIFPDYVDILECVEKVNKEQKLKLDKRAMNNMAEKAFTQLGKHLQEARQNDYWDTFSLNLENNVDPAIADAELMEKLSENKKIADANEKKVFEEFVKKQEEGKTGDKDDSPSEGEGDEDEDEEDEDAEDDEDDEDEDNDKKSDRGDNKDLDVSNDEDVDEDDLNSENGDQDTTSKVLEAIPEIVEDGDEKFRSKKKHGKKISKISDDDKDEDSDATTSKNPVDVTPASSPKKSPPKEAETIEVILDDVDTEDGENKPMKEENVMQQPLRLRSFAKQPETWQSSQETTEQPKGDNDTTTTTKNNKPETLDSTEDEITVVSYLPAKIVKNSTKNEKIATSRLRSSSTATVATSSSAKNSSYLPVASGSTRTNQTSTRSHDNLRNTINLTRPEISLITRRPCTVKPIPIKPRETRLSNSAQPAATIDPTRTRNSAQTPQPKITSVPIATSTPNQRSQILSNRIAGLQSRVPLQQTNQMQATRLINDKMAAAAIDARPLNVDQTNKMAANANAVKYQIQLVRGGIANPATNYLPRQNNQPPPNKVAIPHATPGAQSTQMQLMRTSNGRYVTVPVASLRNTRMDDRVLRNNNLQPRK